MAVKEQKPEEKSSELEAAPTYGEKAYDRVFNKLINFWTTLAISGLFAFWVNHSKKPLPKFIFKGKVPYEFHQWVSGKFQSFSWVPSKDVAQIMADALTINLPGTLTILPSTWLGGKYKTQFVEWMDRRHYGPDAEDDPRIVERHRIVEHERRPTFVASALGRLGVMGVSVAVGRLFGAKINEIQKFADKKGYEHLSKYPGFDAWTSKIGDSGGDVLAELIPKLSNGLNRVSRGLRFGWAEDQREIAGALFNEPNSYNRALQDWMKWTSLDLIYTGVTSTTIHPFMKALKHVPILTYHDHKLHFEKRNHEAVQPADHAHIHAEAVPMAVTPAAIDEKTDTAKDKPHSQIKEASHFERVHSAPVHGADVRSQGA